ncbi:MAG: C40 family peptidase [Psychroflexus sp.]
MNFINIKYRFFLALLFALIISSCGSKKNISNTNNNRINNAKTLQIVKYAKSFLGTPYKYGGTTSKGMDCSGLVQTSFLQFGLELPRTSRDMSNFGKSLKLKNVEVGDLVFFRTSKNHRKINHVGLVVKKYGDQIEFIHSSSTRGVMISSIKNPYWEKNYVKSRRVLN